MTFPAEERPLFTYFIVLLWPNIIYFEFATKITFKIQPFTASSSLFPNASLNNFRISFPRTWNAYTFYCLYAAVTFPIDWVFPVLVMVFSLCFLFLIYVIIVISFVFFLLSFVALNLRFTYRALILKLPESFYCIFFYRAKRQWSWMLLYALRFLRSSRDLLQCLQLDYFFLLPANFFLFFLAFSLFLICLVSFISHRAADRWSLARRT